MAYNHSQCLQQVIVWVRIVGLQQVPFVVTARQDKWGEKSRRGKSILSSTYYDDLPGVVTDGSAAACRVKEESDGVAHARGGGCCKLCSVATAFLFLPGTCCTRPSMDIRTLHPRLASSPPMSSGPHAGRRMDWIQHLPLESSREMFFQLKFWITLSLGFCDGEALQLGPLSPA